MKILFVGGTGIISTACSRLAVERGFQVTLLNRSKTGGVEGCRQIVADIYDPVSARQALDAESWDVVVDFLCFNLAQLEQRLDLFRGHCGQYLFISSASAYQKPPSHYVITESTPLVNPFWDYSRDKIACEDRLLRALREEAFPVTIVRPSFTYGDTVFPLAVNSWARSYTAVDRLRKGLPVIIPGDGLTLWTVTHNSDFAKGLVGLLGNQSALGQAFHITSDEVLTWEQIYRATAEAAGVDTPNLVKVPVDLMVTLNPGYAGPLLGDKVNNQVFDNTKIKRCVPGYTATTRYREGIAKTVAWYDADASRRLVDEAACAEWDRFVLAREKGLEAALRSYQG